MLDRTAYGADIGHHSSFHCSLKASSKAHSSEYSIGGRKILLHNFRSGVVFEERSKETITTVEEKPICQHTISSCLAETMLVLRCVVSTRSPV
jgi:hypothetical protein